jgi:WD40 repeat protein
MSFLRRIRFSLRTLLILVLLVGSAMGLWWKWTPWVLERSLEKHVQRTWAVAFAPNGRLIAAAGDDDEVRVWDAGTGALLTILRGHEARLHSVAFSPDSSRLVTASEDKTARIWDVAQGREILILSGHAGIVHCAAYSPDGLLIVTASGDYKAFVWDAASGEKQKELKGHKTAVYSAAFSPDGKRVVTGSSDWTARVWAWRDERELLCIRGLQPTRWYFVYSAIFSHDGQRVLTATSAPFQYVAEIRDAAAGTLQLTLAGNTFYVKCAAFSPDDRRVVTASLNNMVRVYDAANGDLLASLTDCGAHRDGPL